MKSEILFLILEIRSEVPL